MFKEFKEYAKYIIKKKPIDEIFLHTAAIGAIPILFLFLSHKPPHTFTVILGIVFSIPCLCISIPFALGVTTIIIPLKLILYLFKKLNK